MHVLHFSVLLYLYKKKTLLLVKEEFFNDLQTMS